MAINMTEGALSLFELKSTFSLWYGIKTSNIDFWLLIVIGRDIVTEHKKVYKQYN